VKQGNICLSYQKIWRKNQSVKALRSFQAKVIWAHQHLEALRDAIGDFGRSKPCVVVHDFDPKSVKHTWHVSGKPDTPPQQLSLRLGDTLNNLRAVLDHLAWDLVLANGKSPRKSTGFPICETPESFASDGVQKMIAAMADPVQAKIEELQPYKTINSHDTNHALGLLNRLGNIEKHRHFNFIAASVDLAAFNVDEGLLTSSYIHQGPIEDGTVLAVAEGQMNVNFLTAFGIAFGQGGIADGEIVDELMIRIELAVQDVLYDLAGFVP
jgi:hypothetical protein